MGITKAVILAAGKGSRMQSELPKVLHRVEDKTMIEHTIENAKEAGITDVIIVVGYKKEMIMEHLGDRVKYAVQDEQLGTGHAVMMARDLLEGFDGNVLVLYGDMPLISPKTIRQLVEARESDARVKASIVTMVLDNPPHFGRIVRDGEGNLLRSVEHKDATEEQRLIKEVNVGMYCFDNRSLLDALDQLRPENVQGEYYLTDTLEVIVKGGGKVATVQIENLEETLGINDPSHLQFAEALSDIRYAENFYDIVDQIVEVQKSQKRKNQGS